MDDQRSTNSRSLSVHAQESRARRSFRPFRDRDREFEKSRAKPKKRVVNFDRPLVSASHSTFQI